MDATAETGTLTLDLLPDHAGGIILKLRCSGYTRRRLLDLGFVPGTKVEKVRHSPFGDPIAFRVRGTLIALRRETASQIVISLPGGEGHR